MRFTIPKGKEFYCEFLIKEPGSSTPMDLTGAAGTFSLSSIGPNAYPEIIDAPMAVSDAINGIISVTLDATETKDLVSDTGFAEDGYMPVATYKARLDVTGVTEPISVDIRQVYISDMGTM